MSKRDPHYVERLRVADSSAAAAAGWKNTPEVGARRYSRTFPTATAAKREADAWNSTGDWVAVVRAGRAPRLACGVEACADCA